MLSEGPKAFFVELVDASVLVDGEDAKDESLELPDARANGDSLYRGVFWQVNTYFPMGNYTSCRVMRYETNERGGGFPKKWW